MDASIILLHVDGIIGTISARHSVGGSNNQPSAKQHGNGFCSTFPARNSCRVTFATFSFSGVFDKHFAGRCGCESSALHCVRGCDNAFRTVSMKTAAHSELSIVLADGAMSVNLVVRSLLDTTEVPQFLNGRDETMSAIQPSLLVHLKSPPQATAFVLRSLEFIDC